MGLEVLGLLNFNFGNRYVATVVFYDANIYVSRADTHTHNAPILWIFVVDVKVVQACNCNGLENYI